MGVDHGRVVPAGEVRHAAAEHRPEPAAALERHDLDAVRFELSRPDAGIVKTTHHRRSAILQSARQLDHQPLRAARIEAQHNLQDARLVHDR